MTYCISWLLPHLFFESFCLPSHHFTRLAFLVLSYSIFTFLYYLCIQLFLCCYNRLFLFSILFFSSLLLFSALLILSHPLSFLSVISSDYESIIQAGLLILINDRYSESETAHDIIINLAENNEIEYETVYSTAEFFASLLWYGFGIYFFLDFMIIFNCGRKGYLS